MNIITEVNHTRMPLESVPPRPGRNRHRAAQRHIREINVVIHAVERDARAATNSYYPFISVACMPPTRSFRLHPSAKHSAYCSPADCCRLLIVVVVVLVTVEFLEVLVLVVEVVVGGLYTTQASLPSAYRLCTSLLESARFQMCMLATSPSI